MPLPQTKPTSLPQQYRIPNQPRPPQGTVPRYFGGSQPLPATLLRPALCRAFRHKLGRKGVAASKLRALTPPPSPLRQTKPTSPVPQLLPQNNADCSPNRSPPRFNAIPFRRECSATPPTSSPTQPRKANRLRSETLLCWTAAWLNATRRLPLCPRASTGQRNNFAPGTRLRRTAALPHRNDPRFRPQTRLRQTAKLLHPAPNLARCQPRSTTGLRCRSAGKTSRFSETLVLPPCCFHAEDLCLA